MSLDAAAGASLKSAGLDEASIAAWLTATPRERGDYDGDRRRYSQFWKSGDDLIRRLPAKPKRSEAEAAAAQSILAAAREQRERFLRIHADTLYNELTRNCTRFIRLEDLVFAAAEVTSGLTPTPAQVAAEAQLLQSEKDGVEIDQGIFLAHVLASETAGRHLCHAMLLPRPETADALKNSMPTV